MNRMGTGPVALRLPQRTSHRSLRTTVKALERMARIYSDFANGLLSTDELILDFGASRCLLLSRDEIRLCGFLQCVNRAQAQITMPMVPNVMSTRLINSWSCI